MALNERDVSDPRLERLYRDAALEEPPAHLDAAILAAARREVGARPRALSSVLRRWHVPVSIAAVVVVSVTLVILITEEGGERIGEPGVPPVAAPTEPHRAAPTQAPAAAVAEQAVKPQVDAPAPAEHRGLRDDARSSIADSGREQPGRRESTAQESAAAPASPAAAKADRLRAVTPESKVMARAMAVKPGAQDRPPVWQGFEKEPPEKWLARIEELMREGRATEAEEMRAEFKHRFPEHPLAQGAK